MSRKNTFDDVFKFVRVAGPDECWLWTGTISRKGLPEFTVDGKKYSAYRVAKWVADGNFNIHDERIVPMHQCKDDQGRSIDNPLCCNPRHTTLGTHEDNQLDMMLKGRAGLTKDMIRDILHYHKEFPDLTHGQLAKKIEYKYQSKVSRQAITDILNQRRRSVLQEAIRAEDAALTQEKKDEH
jgi:hypothetical protein